MKADQKNIGDYVAQLESVIKQMLKPLKNVPFNMVIHAMTGFDVLIFSNKNPVHLKIVKCLKMACENAIEMINQNGIQSKRPNEVGNYVEPYLKAALNQIPKLKADTPPSSSGKKKSSGYPDIEVNFDKTTFYVECKTYNLDNIHTTQRSFYFSPSEAFKVTKSALHLMVSFEVVVVSVGVFKVNGYKIFSLDNLSLDVKYEFNSDNHRMYSGKHGTQCLAEKRDMLAM